MLDSITLFTPAILCSRIIVFNTKEVAKDTNLRNLDLMTFVADKIDLGYKRGPGAKFGDLIIVINQLVCLETIHIRVINRANS